MPNGMTVSNSSCLIGLQSAGLLDILEKLYTNIEVPDAVAAEFGIGLPAWVLLRSVKNQALVQSLRLQLGSGEAEAIALAMESAAARLILDDKKARTIARQLGIPITGTVGIVLRAKDQGLVNSVRDVLNALQAANFHISSALQQEALKRAGE